MEKYLSCAVTGHRPTRFKFKYQESNTACKRLKKRLHDQFALLYEKGVRTFYIGGALGVGLWAGENLLMLKEQPEYSDLELVIALPYEGYDANWQPVYIRRWERLMRHAKGVVTVSGTPGPVGYRRREHYMVDHADVLVAIYDNDHSVRNDIGHTVNYARNNGLPIILIHPDKGTVTYENMADQSSAD